MCQLLGGYYFNKKSVLEDTGESCSCSRQYGQTRIRKNTDEPVFARTREYDRTYSPFSMRSIPYVELYFTNFVGQPSHQSHIGVR